MLLLFYLLPSYRVGLPVSCPHTIDDQLSGLCPIFYFYPFGTRYVFCILISLQKLRSSSKRVNTLPLTDGPLKGKMKFPLCSSSAPEILVSRVSSA